MITRRETNENTMIHTMARGFLKSGHDVTLLSSEEYRPMKRETTDFEIVYFKSRMPGVFKPDLLPFPKGLKKWLRNHSQKYDLAIASDTFMMPTLAAALYCRCRLVIWQELDKYQRMMHQIPAKVWYNVVARIFMRNVRVIARSPKARDFIGRFLNDVATETVDHGADSDIFTAEEEKNDRSFIVISQLIKRKRIDRIIRNFARFVGKPEFSNYVLNIVGDGPERDSLEKLASDLGVSDNVVFHGYLFHDRFAPLSRKSTALLIDTERDLNMVSVPESIANGTPVLMNTVANTASFINSHRLGLAVDDWDERHLEEMTRRYDEFHANCLQVRDSVTNEGCAKKLIELAYGRS